MNNEILFFIRKYFMSFLKEVARELIISFLLFSLFYFSLDRLNLANQFYGFLENGFGVYQITLLALLILLLLYFSKEILSFLRKYLTVDRLTFIDRQAGVNILISVMWSTIYLPGIDWNRYNFLGWFINFIILVSMLWLSGRITFTVTKKNSKFHDDDTLRAFLTDTPIKSQEEDLLSRNVYVARIAEIIKSQRGSDSLVIAIRGSWGIGKSSVLNLLDDQLSRHKTLEVLRFDPWYFNSTEHLIRSFFFELERKIEPLITTNGLSYTVRKTFARYTKHLSELPILSVDPSINFLPFLNVKIPLISKESISNPEKIKNDLDDILSHLSSRVVILIDNIDRIDTEEMLLVFKLVRLCSDFQNLIFVLAYDYEQVVNRLSLVKLDNDFMSKIVQVELDLPIPDQSKITEVVSKGLIKIGMVQDVIFSKEDFERFAPFYKKYLEAKMIADLRSAKRFLNSVSFALPLVKNEVNYSDFWSIEAIRLFFPEVYYELPNYMGELTGYNPDTIISLNKNKVSEKLGQFKKSIEDRYKSDSRTILEALGYLFPNFGNYLQDFNISQSQPNNRNAVKQQLVSSYAHFNRYFRLQVALDDIPTSLVLDFISNLNSPDKTRVLEWSNSFEDLQRNNQLGLFLKKLVNNESRLNAIGRETLVNLIAGSTDRLIWAGWNSEMDIAENLARDCIYEIETEGDRNEFIKNVILSAKSLLFVSLFVNRFQQDLQTKLFNRGGYNPSWYETIFDLMRRSFLHRIENELLSSGMNIFFKYKEDADTIINFWRNEYINDEKRALGYVYMCLEEDPKSILLLLASYVSVYLTGEPASLDFQRLREKYEVDRIYRMLTSISITSNLTTKEIFAINEFRQIYDQNSANG